MTEVGGSSLGRPWVNRKKRILVVDDEPDFCAIVQRNLVKAGFQVDVAYDGVEGLQKIKQQPPDAIVLDVLMPELDGHAVCRELKMDQRFCCIPIIMLTAETSQTFSRRYTGDNGSLPPADGYLPKPASGETIARYIRELLNMPAS
jgi:two-component system alkaline phosphatase synthesis response regulator PhoP